MRRREFIAGVALAAWPLATRAQQARAWKVGVIDTTSRELNSANMAALQQGLRELGYVEGQNLKLEYRSGDGSNQRLADFAAELVRLKVDVIVVRGTPQALAAKNAAAEIPIVMAAIADPVGTGLVSSLARPGGNITGLSSFHTELGAKRIEWLRLMVPGITRIGTIRDFSNPTTTAQFTLLEKAAASLHLALERFDVRGEADLRPAFEAAARHHVDALVVGIDTVTATHRQQIVDLAALHKMPAIYAAPEFVQIGGLMAYGVSYPHLYYRAATFIDKIFKGAKPSDLPVEEPTKLELVINRRTATALGLGIPEPLLVASDEVLE